jgi:hypothetical protein
VRTIFIYIREPCFRRGTVCDSLIRSCVMHLAAIRIERIDDLKVELVDRVVPGAFLANETFTSNITLEEGALYAMSLSDDYGDGLKSGPGGMCAGLTAFGELLCCS